MRSAIETWLLSLPDIHIEIVLVDDGSSDHSFELCSEWAQSNPIVKLIGFSRNFGHQSAVSAGLCYATGEAVVIIDADLQDPLDVIPKMIQSYEEGYDVVYGQRTLRRGETLFKRGSAWIFYRLMRWGVHKNLPVDTGDFRLVSRKCVDAINAMPESHRFLRGMFAWVGFSQQAVLYERKERLYGDTNYPLRKMLRFAWQGITSFSTLPIQLVSITGFCIAAIGIAVCLYAVISWLRGDVVPGWTSLMGWTAFLGGMVLCSLGIIGEYIGKIYEEVKHRPLYIIRRTVNCPQSHHVE
ncbi:MAG: glycosyltransferase family 2 protein [Bilophila wadsworthia]|uniref:glycosyltransferase family 2 protein n=1 Tax=Bilophila wadsworthia TaxID=35833 RepID=UPI0024305765|nr:glycosyltransferase family 2 protein [Bilophila wadsworthia]MCI6540453.1 glycosyltransferase family 2 protein [Bilophila wadsworthia]